ASAVRPHHRGRSQGKPSARHPDDRRGSQLPGALMNDAVEIGLGRSARRGYSLDDIGIVPSRRTRDIDVVSLTWQIDAYRFELPLVGFPSDATMSPTTIAEVARIGGLGVLDAEGIWTRYDDP